MSDVLTDILPVSILGGLPSALVGYVACFLKTKEACSLQSVSSPLREDLRTHWLPAELDFDAGGGEFQFRSLVQVVGRKAFRGVSKLRVPFIHFCKTEKSSVFCGELANACAPTLVIFEVTDTVVDMSASDSEYFQEYVKQCCRENEATPVPYTLKYPLLRHYAFPAGDGFDKGYLGAIERVNLLRHMCQHATSGLTSIDCGPVQPSSEIQKTVRETMSSTTIEQLKWVVAKAIPNPRGSRAPAEKWWDSWCSALNNRKLKKLGVACLGLYGNGNKLHIRIKHLQVGITRLLEHEGELEIRGEEFLNFFGNTKAEYMALEKQDKDFLRYCLKCYYFPEREEGAYAYPDAITNAGNCFHCLSDAGNGEIPVLRNARVLTGDEMSHRPFAWLTPFVLANLSTIFPSLEYVTFSFFIPTKARGLSLVTDEERARMEECWTAFLDLPSSFGRYGMHFRTEWLRDAESTYVLPEWVKSQKKPKEEKEGLPWACWSVIVPASCPHTLFEGNATLPDDWLCRFHTIHIVDDTDEPLRTSWNAVIEAFISMPLSSFHPRFFLVLKYGHSRSSANTYSDAIESWTEYISKKKAPWKIAFNPTLEGIKIEVDTRGTVMELE